MALFVGIGSPQAETAYLASNNGDDDDDEIGSGFNPPPDHTDRQEGFLHKPGKENPFSNGCRTVTAAN